MARQLAAVGFLACALLMPALCEALCLLPEPAMTPEHCHEGPAPASTPAPESEHSDCCNEVVFVGSSSPPELRSFAPLLAAAFPLDQLEVDREAPLARLPRPPDGANSPYVRVNPPRLVYLP